MNDFQKIEKKIDEYVTGLYDSIPTKSLVFHNLNHTKTVVKRTQEIAGHYNVSEKEMFILFSAAWFHDSGYLFSGPENHEEMSCNVMKKFLEEEGIDEEIITEIAGCIMATKAPREPKNLLQQIICDADTYHLGTKDFKETNKQMWEEQSLRSDHEDPIAFKDHTVAMLEKHQFYTNYCKQLLNKRKGQNLKKLKDKTKSAKEQKIKDNTPIAFSDVEKDKSGLMSKGIQTMLRLTSENHLKLSEMADHKANILISVNSIIISVILSVLLRKLSEETYLIIPTIIFLLVAVTTIVISILATRPKISGGEFTMEEVKERKNNLLFFGNFYKATYEQYDLAMKELMLDTDYLYGTLIKDIYFLGKVLGRKYKLIRLAYNIFMIGIIVSVLAFAIATFFSQGSSSGNIINSSGSPL